MRWPRATTPGWLTSPGSARVTDPAHGTTNYQSFWLLLDDQFPVTRNELMARFTQRSISTRRGIMAADLEPACQRFLSAPLPHTELLAANSIILPLFHDMTDDDLDRVVDVLRHAADPVSRSDHALS